MTKVLTTEFDALETMRDVAEFHAVYQVPVRSTPGFPPRAEGEAEDLALVAHEMNRVQQLCYNLAKAHRRRGGGSCFTRLQLLQEELTELAEAMGGADIVGCLDGLTDIQYVLDGVYLALGLHTLKMPAFKEVQRSNMSKLGEDGQPIINEAGRVVKGPNYSPPDLESVLKETETS